MARRVTFACRVSHARRGRRNPKQYQFGARATFPKYAPHDRLPDEDRASPWLDSLEAGDRWFAELKRTHPGPWKRAGKATRHNPQGRYAVVYHWTRAMSEASTEVVDAATVRLMPEEWQVQSWHATRAAAEAALAKELADAQNPRRRGRRNPHTPHASLPRVFVNVLRYVAHLKGAADPRHIARVQDIFERWLNKRENENHPWRVSVIDAINIAALWSDMRGEAPSQWRRNAQHALRELQMKLAARIIREA